MEIVLAHHQFMESEYEQYQGLQPEVFFKMSHEIYNYGEGVIGKVAADHSHKWIYKEPNDQEMNFLSAWHNSADSHPRTWEAQFQSGIKTIVLIAVREGVIQLGAVQKVIEDLSYVVLLRKKLSYIESIPGVLLPHPSSSAYPFKIDGYGAADAWQFQGSYAPSPQSQYYDQFNYNMRITPSMSSLESLLSKLPAVGPATTAPVSAANYCHDHSQPQYFPMSNMPVEFMEMGKVAKDEIDDGGDVGESSSSMSAYHQHFGYQNDLNVGSSSMPKADYC